MCHTIQISIRAVCPDDIAAIAALESAISNNPWRANAFSDMLRSNDSLHAAAMTDSNTVAGYVCGRQAADECEIYKLAVDEKHRRQGIAEKLLRHIEDSARTGKLTAIYLEVAESNTAALSLYTKLGYERCGLRKGYYAATGEAAVCMRRNIDFGMR